VGSSSATEAAYGPLGRLRQQLFFSPLAAQAAEPKTPTPRQCFDPFERAKPLTLLLLAFRRSRAPRRPGALTYGGEPADASSFLQGGEIFCR
jgi:hypothetical protein